MNRTRTKHAPISNLATVVLTALLFLMGSARPSLGQCEWEPVEPWTGLNNQVIGSAVWDPDGDGPEPDLLVAIGRFTVAGEHIVNGIAQWDGTRWLNRTPGLNNPGITANLDCVTVWNGKLVVARDGAVKQWSGSEWQNIGTGIGNVTALTVYNGSLIVTHDNRIPKRWTGTSWQALTTEPNGFVRAMVQHNGDLIVMGDFTTIGGIIANKIAAWNGTSWRALGTGLNSGGSALASDGVSLYAGGYFATAGGVQANGVARWDGTAWRAMGAGFTNGLSVWVRALIIHQGIVYASGEFSGSGGTPLPGLAAWNGSAWVPVGNLPGHAGVPYTLTVFRGDLITGGYLVESLWSNVSRWDGTQWHACGTTTRREASFIARLQDSLFVAGARFISGASSYPYSSLFDGETWTSIPTDELPILTYVTHVTPDRLLAVGYNGNIWEFDGTTWVMRAPSIGSSYRAYCVTTFQDEIVVGGGSGTGPYRLSGTAWVPLGNPLYSRDSDGLNVCTITSLVEYNGELYAAGSFESRIAKLVNNQWVPVSGVYSQTAPRLFAYNGTLVVGGQVNLNGQWMLAAAFNGSTWSPMGTVPGQGVTYPSASGFLVNEGRMLAVTNSIPDIYYTSRARVVEWNGMSWDPVGPEIYGTASNLAMLDDSLYVSGEFVGTAAGSMPYIARLDCSCPADLDNGTSTGTRDEAVTIDDLLFFLVGFEAGVASADLDNGSGTGTRDNAVTIDDLLYFLVHFEEGC